MARNADHRANDAQRIARDARTVAIEAKEESRSAIEGYRSVYQALGELTAEVARLAGGQEELSAWVRRAMHDSLRPPAPSHHDIEEVVARAASKAAEETGRHIVIPSDRVNAALKRTGHELFVRGVLTIIGYLVAALVGAFITKVLWR